MRRAFSVALFGCVSTFHTYSSFASVWVTRMCGYCGTSLILFTCLHARTQQGCKLCMRAQRAQQSSAHV